MTKALLDQFIDEPSGQLMSWPPNPSQQQRITVAPIGVLKFLRLMQPLAFHQRTSTHDYRTSEVFTLNSHTPHGRLS